MPCTYDVDIHVYKHIHVVFQYESFKKLKIKDFMTVFIGGIAYWSISVRMIPSTKKKQGKAIKNPSLNLSPWVSSP